MAEEFRLETARLILRDWREEDRAPFLAHTNTPAVMRWLGGVAEAPTVEAAFARLEDYRQQYGFTFWVVERKRDGGPLAGELLGFCGLKRANLKPGPIGDVEIGWRLREDAWGRGYAREAALAALDLAFTRFDAPHVVALTVVENTASWGLMERLGMRRREDLDFRAKDEAAWAENVIVYDLTRAAWRAR
jgi:RimJ/RimL family protein N-acetyltransferase